MVTWNWNVSPPISWAPRMSDAPETKSLPDTKYLSGIGDGTVQLADIVLISWDAVR